MREYFDITISLKKKKESAANIPRLEKEMTKLAIFHGYEVATTSIPDNNYKLGDKVAVKLSPESKIVYSATILGYGDYGDNGRNCYCLHIDNEKRIFVDYFSNIYPYKEYEEYRKNMTKNIDKEQVDKAVLSLPDYMVDKVKEICYEMLKEKEPSKDENIL